jgi:hypothetical protein
MRIVYNFSVIGIVEIIVRSRKLSNFTLKSIKSDLIYQDLEFKSKDIIVITISESLFYNKSSIDYLLTNNPFSKFSMNIEHKNSKIILTVKKLTKKKAIKMFYSTFNRSILHSVFYEFILYPIFYLFTILDGYYLLHGSVFEYNDKLQFLIGFEGTGKSTLANKLSDSSTGLYCDNFVLFNGSKLCTLLVQTDTHSLYRESELTYKKSRIIDLNTTNFKVNFLYVSDRIKDAVITGGNIDLLILSNKGSEISGANYAISDAFLINKLFYQNKNNSELVKTINFIGIPYGKLDMVKSML